MEDQSSSCPVSASSPPVHSSSSSSPPPTSPLSHSVDEALDPLAAAVIASCGPHAITSSSGVITPPASAASSNSSSTKSTSLSRTLLTSDPDIDQVTTYCSDHLIMPSITTASPSSMVATSSPASSPSTPVVNSAKTAATTIPSFPQVIANPMTNSSNNNNQQQQQQQWYPRAPVHSVHPSGPPSPPSSTIGLMQSAGAVDHHQFGPLTAVVVSSPYASSPHSSPTTLYSHHSHPNMVHHGAITGPTTVTSQYPEYYNSYYTPYGDNYASVAEFMASPPQSNESMHHSFTSAGTINSNITHSHPHAVHHLTSFSPRSTSMLLSSSASPVASDPLSPHSEVSPSSSTGTSSSVCHSDQLEAKPNSMGLLDHNLGSNHNQNDTIGNHFHHHHHHHHHSSLTHFRNLQIGENITLQQNHNPGIMIKSETDPSSPSLVSSTSSMVGNFITSNGTVHSSTGGSNLIHTSDGPVANTGNSRPHPARSPFEWMTASKKSNSSNNNNNGNSNNNNSNGNSQVTGNNGSNNGTNNSNNSYGSSQAPPGKL